VKIVDANILLYAVNRGAPQHARCRTWLEEALKGNEAIAFPWIALLAFLRISTQSGLFDKPLTVGEACDHVTDWLSAPAARLTVPMVDHWTTLRELILAVGTGGNLITDAHLAALAISHGATLISTDNDFARFRRLKWENPLAVP
jgi:toxin-antitoxin system PIN domain toxin